MPTDFQIIDSFERLREEFSRENPAFTAVARQMPEGGNPGEWVTEAWIQAIEGPAAAGAQQRRVRGLARAILAGRIPVEEGDGEGNGDGFADLQVREWAAALPEKIELARKKKLWPLVADGPERTPMEEVRAWGRLLPGLSGLRAWRFVERLGRPVVAPETQTRRFLWRFGLLEESPERAATLQNAHSLLEQVARLTGLAPAMLDALLGWLTTGDRELEGGRWCVLKPRCAACPCRPDCAWARFHPHEEPAAKNPRDDRRMLEPLHRQIATGRQDQLQEIELLAILLQKGGPEAGVLELAETLLRRLGGLRGLEMTPVSQMITIRGITENRALQIKASLELGRRLATRALMQGDPIACSEDVFRAYCSRFRHLPQEHFIVVLVDAKNRVIHDHIVSKGTLTGSLAHPREVFQEAIRYAAAGIILLHNHPSGDPQPSREDHAVTTRLQDAGQILGIRVLDHIILGADSYYSFKDEGDL